MSRRKKIIFGSIATLVVAIAAGAYAINQMAVGIPAFYLWRAGSGKLQTVGRADVNGISIYYEVYGDGRPILVLHGAGAFLESMNHQIRALASDHRVIAVDSRGQGRSTDSDAPITYSQMGDDMIKLLDSMQLRQADVVGWSDGGIVGLDMAMKHPDRVRRLVAVSANYDVDGVDQKQMTPEMLAEIETESKLFYDLIAPDPSHFPVMMRKVMTMVQTEPHYTVEELGEIRSPTLIVAGEDDIILADHTAKLAAAIPGAKKIIVPRASHMGPLEQPEVYNALIGDFLDAP